MIKLHSFSVSFINYTYYFLSVSCIQYIVILFTLPFISFISFSNFWSSSFQLVLPHLCLIGITYMIMCRVLFTTACSMGKLPVAIPLPLATLNYWWLLWSGWGFTNPTPLLTECWRSQSYADCCAVIITKFMSHSELRTSEHPSLSYRSCVLATPSSLMISGLYIWWSTYLCNLFSILSPVLSDCTNCCSLMKEISLIKAYSS